jgi:putative ABC transport system permease protein
MRGISQVAFAFRGTPELLGTGLFYGWLMGLIGGLLPAAIRAARLPISSAFDRPTSVHVIQ